MTNAEKVEETYRKLCKEGQVLIEGQCVDVVMKPKERMIEYIERKSCRLEAPKVNPITARAKQKLFNEIYKDKSAHMHLSELIGPSSEES